MSEHYRQLPTPSEWSAMESNNRQNQQHSVTTGTSPPQQAQTPETTRRLLFQPMKNSRSSIEGTSPPKHYESRTGSSMLVISQYDTKDQSTTLTPVSTSPKPSTSPSQHPIPPTKQDHYQDFSLIARDHPPSATPLTQSASNPLPPREYQSPSAIQRNRTATSYTTHTSPSTLVSPTPPPKSSHNSDSSSAVHYQSIAPITAVIPPPHTVDPKSHYMAVPDFSKFQVQKSESLGATPPVPARRTHAATVMTDRRVDTVASDSALYFPKAKLESTEPAFVAPPQRDEYQKIPSKEEMQSMIMQKRNAQNQSKPQPTPSSPPEENNEASNQNEKTETETVPPPKQEDKVEAPHTTPEKPESTIIEGFLGKKGDVGVIKAWKRRWFVLRLDLLVYYKSQEDREQNLVIGFIPLCDASAVYPSSNAPTNTAFQIDTKERVWYLRADTRAEMEQWIDACKANCNIKELVTPLDEVQKRQSMVAIARNQTLMKEGDLEKLHGTVFKMRKVYVKSGILYKYINKTDPQPSKVTLFKCIIEDEVPEHGPLAFRVSTESKVFTFRASSDRDKEEWLELLMKHKLLTETIINPH